MLTEYIENVVVNSIDNRGIHKICWDEKGERIKNLPIADWYCTVANSRPGYYYYDPIEEKNDI